MNDWERAQNLVAQVTGGRVTPGSGNGRLKGDVRKDDWVFEVKQTERSSLALQRVWFSKLLKQAKTTQVAFVIFFELRGYPYFYQREEHDQDIEWKSLSTKEDNLPKEIYTGQNTKWVLKKWSDLANL